MIREFYSSWRLYFLMICLFLACTAQAQAPVTLATLDSPTLFAVDATGNLFAQTESGDFMDSTLGIAKINPSGVVTSVINPLITYAPESLAMDHNGNFYIREGDGINKIAPDGEITPVGVGSISNTRKLVCDLQGNLFVLEYYSADNYMVKKITPSGTVSTVIGPGIINTWNAFCVDANGNVYVVNYNVTTTVYSILKISADGNYTVIAGNGILNSLIRMTCDAAGNLYVVTTPNNSDFSISKLSVQGNYTTLFSEGLPDYNSPTAIVVDAAGAVFLSYKSFMQPGTILKFTAPGCTPTTTTEIVTASNNYTWSENNTTYTTSGIYTNVIGCNTATLNLTINPATTTAILDSQCGVTLAALSTVIVPIAVPLAQGYKYKVTNTATNEVNYYTRSKTATFALSQRADTGSGSVAIKLSSTYAIAVAVKINGVFSDYGDACLVSTPLLPTTKIQDALCGTTLANINSYLYLKAQVAGQKGYRYKVTQGSEERTYDRIVTTFNPFQLKQLVGGAAYATTYEVAVSVFYNGAWQPYGAPCTVTTPAAKQSKLATTQCGITLNKTNTNVLTANYVGVAQAYRFEVSKGASAYTVETASGLLRTFKLTEVAGLTLERGSTYVIRVAIKANGTWQPYGTSCNVTTYGSPAIVKMADPLAKPESVFNALAYPNPFSSAFQLELNTSSKAAVDLKVYDVLGRLIENRQWNAAEASEQEMGNNYPSGVYNIILNQGENAKTLRVIKR
jgi:hypothetical protein